MDIRTLRPTSLLLFAGSLSLSLRGDRWVGGFANVLTVGERDDALAVFVLSPTVGERDDALAVFVLSPTVGEWHCVARCIRCLSTPAIVVVRSLPPSRSLPSGLLLPVLVPALHLCCGLFFSLSLVACSSLSHSIFSFSL